MKKLMNLLLFTVLIGTLSECKKGEDDPFISLRRRKARVVGDWKLTGGTTVYTDNYSSGSSNSSSIMTYNYTETTYSWNSTDVFNGTTTTDGGAGIQTLNLEFKKDGTYSLTRIEDGTVYQETGVWNFTGGVGKEHKNKEQIVLTERSSISGSSATVNTGKEPDYSMTIKELRNKKMVFLIKSTGSSASTFGSGSSTSGSTSEGELIFEQK